MLLWLDLETTGLKAEQSDVLEVAAIITTDEFVEVARLQRVIYNSRAAHIVELLDQGVDYEGISRQVGTPSKPITAYVIEMHAKNGLWRDCVHGQALDTVDRDLCAFIKANGIVAEEYVDTKTNEKKMRNVPPQLAGSTISFDRAYINAYFPRVADEKVLHYRNLDVSTLNEMCKRCFKGLYDMRPNAGRAKEDATHRGMADIEESLLVFKHYRDAFVKAIGSWIHEGGTIEGLVRP